MTRPAPPPAPPEGALVLVVDDDPAIRKLTTGSLRDDGFDVVAAANGGDALELVVARRPDVVVLDLGLPDIDGLDLLGRIRSQRSTPVIVLTARTDEADRILGLDLGADDYITKPFSPLELGARVRAVLRRARNVPAEPVLAYDGLVVDTAARVVEVRGNPVGLAAKEFDLLAFLASSPRQVFTREQLLARVWGSTGEWKDPATITEHVHRLRHKIEDDPTRPRWILTVRRAGYRFEP